jgi:osmotically-inducible protein OsmY
MRRSRRLALLLGLSLGACGCGQDADVLARVSRRAADRLQTAGRGAAGQLTPRLEAARADPTLATRVACRLRWDQLLAGAAIEVSAAEGRVELTGTVADEAHRRRAVELAETTAGVEQVIDSLMTAESPP